MKLDSLPELVCKEVVERITDYLSGVLTDEQRTQIEQHFLECPPCTLYLGQIKGGVELAGSLRERAPTRTVSPSLLDAFRKRKPR